MVFRSVFRPLVPSVMSVYCIQSCGARKVAVLAISPISHMTRLVLLASRYPSLCEGVRKFMHAAIGTAVIGGELAAVVEVEDIVKKNAPNRTSLWRKDAN